MAYSVDMFAKMFHSQERHQSYCEALRRSIKPGDVVIEIGTGIGVYAMEAARLGARKVYAIEPNPLVRLAPALAAANGFEPNHIQFYEEFSTNFDPPELADVVFADLRGRTPLYGANVESLRDAAKRLLKPGGILIPQVDHISAALVEAPSGSSFLWDQWTHNPFGFDLTPALEVQFAQVLSSSVSADQLLTAGERVGEIHYGVDDAVSLSNVWRSSVSRDGVAAGLAVWFDSVLADSVGLGNGPGSAPSVYGGGFLGFSVPVEVRSGDNVELRVNAVGRHGDYEWSWGLDLLEADGSVRARLRGTTLAAVPILASTLALLRPDRVVVPSDRMRSDHRLLELMLAGGEFGSVAATLHVEFPTVFASHRAALDAVVAAAGRYEFVGRLS
jgi:type I protein arginine methyltransferase